MASDFNCCRCVSVHESMNPEHRKTMEDTARVVDSFLHNPNNGFFGVYDGHGGRDVAVFLQTTLHERIATELLYDGEEDDDEDEDETASADSEDGEAAVEKQDVTIEERIERAYVITDMECCVTCSPAAGSTAVTALLLEQPSGERVLFTSNVGDSRAVISHNGTAVRVSKDHKADDPDELARIIDHGGFVLQQRVAGVLAVARSFGDRDLKEFVLAKPDTVATRLEPPEDFPFLVLACDGVWDELSDQEVVDLVSALPESEHPDAARLLVEAALDRRSGDNVTALVVFF